ncbi:FAD-binding oxidoreductase [Paraburkholderia sp. Ac-20347]|nr:FAD-binding oxidoreductase [Paraburkholderia sp. Ac-20347]
MEQRWKKRISTVSPPACGNRSRGRRSDLAFRKCRTPSDLAGTGVRGDPNALVMAYARYFEQLGGRILLGDALTLRQNWSVETAEGRIDAKSVVVSLGPWSDVICSKLG